MLSSVQKSYLLFACFAVGFLQGTGAATSSAPSVAPTTASRPPKTQCKCLPGDPCYPSARDWQTFSSKLSQPLIANQRPLGAACYPSSGSKFSATQCAQFTANINNPIFREGLPNALQYETFEVLFNSSGVVVSECPFDNGLVNATGALCGQGRIPPNAVNVTTVQDIQEAVKFASKNNLKLVVRNKGHEVLGRSGGVGALEVFTHNLQNITFFNSFVPEGAPQNTPGEFAVTLGAGVSWSTAYSQTHAHNRSIPGGMAPFGTVGAAGGWLLGGGHSALTRYFGYGVDNALQFKVVLPNGTFATVNKYRDPDLFWALRGGGGPSFGIVVESTVKTHPDPPYTAFFFVAEAANKDAFTNILEVWNRYHNDLSDAGWAGVWPFTSNLLALSLLNQGVPTVNPNGKTLMDKFLADANAVADITIVTQEYVNYTSFEDFNIDILVNGNHGFNFTQAPPGPPNSVTSSWLLPRNITAASRARDMAEIYVNLTAGATGFMVGGGPAATNNPADVSSTPAFRNIVTDLVLLPTGPGLPPITLDNIQETRRTVNRDNQVFKQLAPPPFGGQYLNEADFLEEDWQVAYWGPNYARLLSIKKRIDPKDLLIVHKGVNSEAWDDEVICKTVS
ncbi:FAD-binding domain-containing protein [Agrocybe pediades]|nr:FAD-binding domain-containing protein [Agrocybe pediades]